MHVMQAVAKDMQQLHPPSTQVAPSAEGGWQVTWTTDAMDHDGAPITDVAFAPALKGLPGGDGHGGWLISVSNSMYGRLCMLPVMPVTPLQQREPCIGMPQADLILHVPQGQSVGTVRGAARQRRSWRHGQLACQTCCCNISVDPPGHLICLCAAPIDAFMPSVCKGPRC